MLHSENGPLIGGSDYYLGRIVDGLDPGRWKAYVLARPNYPLASILQHPERVTHLHYGEPLPGFGPGHPPRGAVTARPAFLACRPHLLHRIWSRAPRTFRRDVGLMHDAKRAARILKPIMPDVFHSVDGGPQPAVIGAVRAGAKVVLGYCAPPPQVPNRGLCRWIERRACQVASICIAKSEFTKLEWAKYLDCAPGRFVVVPNGIEASVFEGIDPVAARSELGLPLGKCIIGMTGRLEKEKGVQTFVRAAQILADGDPQLHFVLTGDGGEAETARQMLRETRMESRCTLLGHRADIPRVTAAYDLAVVPSIWNEPFGWVVLEAMAARKPVIASSVGGIPEIVLDQQTGILVRPRSVEDLVAAVQRLAGNRSLRQQMGESGYQRVTQQFRHSQMLERTIDLYERLCRDCPMEPPPTFHPQRETLPCGLR